ncbi:LysM peptidoglycan-binding domain-containing protein [Neobacillus vireti]|uniref:LysM peptidoglycan-binding domain-containing protein n=1 Tax=Neobacillus vireti TaxID=220686 RepID=UPI002FFFA4C7
MLKIIKLILSLSVLLGLILAPISFISNVNAQTNNGTVYYTIKKDDTFYLLGSRFNSSVREIRSINTKINPYNLKIGSKIKLPIGTGILIHHVLKGDTLGKIAPKYNSTVSLIAAKNYIRNPNLIYSGDILAIDKRKNILTQISGNWKSTNMTKWSGTTAVITPTGTNTFNIDISAYQVHLTANGYEVPHMGDMEGKGTIKNDKIHFIVDENMSGDISLQNEKLIINYNGPRNYQAGANVIYDTDFIRQ